jgi:hypothetical protein
MSTLATDARGDDAATTRLLRSVRRGFARLAVRAAGPPRSRQRVTLNRENTLAPLPPQGRARAQALVLSALALLFVVLWRSPPPRAETAARAAHGALSAVP